MLNLATWIYLQSLIVHRCSGTCTSSAIPVARQIHVVKLLSLHLLHPPCHSAHRPLLPGICTPDDDAKVLAKRRCYCYRSKGNTQDTKYLMASVPHKHWLDIRMQNQPGWAHMRVKKGEPLAAAAWSSKNALPNICYVLKCCIFLLAMGHRCHAYWHPQKQEKGCVAHQVKDCNCVNGRLGRHWRIEKALAFAVPAKVANCDYRCTNGNEQNVGNSQLKCVWDEDKITHCSWCCACGKLPLLRAKTLCERKGFKGVLTQNFHVTFFCCCYGCLLAH